MANPPPSIDLFGETSSLLDALERRGVEDAWAARRRGEASFAGAWVVPRDALIRMKTWAGRDQDLADVRRLEELDR